MPALIVRYMGWQWMVALLLPLHSEAAHSTPPSVAAVHLFEWPWESVARECEQVLGPKGFDAVQVSPANEHIVGPEWWTRYQPVSWKLSSRSGDEAAFRDMVQRCNAVGVMVVVDAVINHMGRQRWKGVAGSTFGNRTYPNAGLAPEDFHHNPGDLYQNCAMNFDHLTASNIVHAFQDCDFLDLPDLCTECPHTRGKIIDFLRKVASVGPRVGFRVDSAKNIPPPLFSEIIAAAGGPWEYAEVHSPSGDPAPLQPAAYMPAGHVTEFEFSLQVGALFKEPGRLGNLSGVGERSGLVKSEKAVVFIENHDTMHRPGCFSCAPVQHDDGAKFFLANVFMLAWPYGYPLVMSSYAYKDLDQGPPAYPVHCGSEWLCEHRRPEVMNMVAWRRTAGAAPVQGFAAEGAAGNHVHFNRGGVAFLALNRDEAHPWAAGVQTGLPQGAYCDVVQSDDVASCPVVEVDSTGYARITVGPVAAVALHTGKLRAARPHAGGAGPEGEAQSTSGAGSRVGGSVIYP